MSRSRDDKTGGLTRRGTLRGMGAALGVATVGCTDDTGGGRADGSGSGGGAPSEPSGDSSGSGDSSDASGLPGVDDGATDTGLPSDDAASSDAGTGAPADACGPDAMGWSAEELLADVDTIVVVMMENRSTDHYFGSATFLEGWTLEGLTGEETNRRIDGTPVGVFPLLNLSPADPPHQWADCHLQWNLGENDGFVIVHENEHPASYDEVMGYHVRHQLPVLYALADEYVLFDHWFGSAMAGTWPNRFHLHAATSNGQQENRPEASITPIWEVLADAGVSHANYYSDVAWAWGAFLDPLASYTAPIEEFFDAAQRGTLPAFSIVDPNFGLLPGAEGGNDDHPDHDITLGQIFLGSVYQALAQSPHWERCLLVITYDEHGGFFDHVSPPTTYDTRAPFQQLGHRVPSLVIGPHVRRGCVDSTVVDHVSVLSTVTRRFGLPPLNERVNQTTDLSSAIDPERLGAPRPPAPIPAMAVSVSQVLAKRGSGQHELEAMIASGDVRLPRDRRHANASHEVAVRMLDRAARLGVVSLRP